MGIHNRNILIVNIIDYRNAVSIVNCMCKLTIETGSLYHLSQYCYRNAVSIVYFLSGLTRKIRSRNISMLNCETFILKGTEGILILI